MTRYHDRLRSREQSRRRRWPAAAAVAPMLAAVALMLAAEAAAMEVIALCTYTRLLRMLFMMLFMMYPARGAACLIMPSVLLMGFLLLHRKHGSSRRLHWPSIAYQAAV